jgi:DNA-binding NarL/FixJ family response regulator
MTVPIDNMPINVVICDDHALVRSGLHRVLDADPGLAVVGEAASADEALALVQELPTDVLLLDVTMPGRSGIEALPDLVAAAPATKVLMLSMQDDPAYVRQSFAAGADGYLVKDAADAELLAAIHEVQQGHRYVHPALGAILATAEAAAPVGPGEGALSEREREVLRLLALGHTNQEIAKLLFISIRTAESHRARIVQKLGLKTRAEIVRYALASGELEVGRPAA